MILSLLSSNKQFTRISTTGYPNARVPMLFFWLSVFVRSCSLVFWEIFSCEGILAIHLVPFDTSHQHLMFSTLHCRVWVTVQGRIVNCSDSRDTKDSSAIDCTLTLVNGGLCDSGTDVVFGVSSGNVSRKFVPDHRTESLFWRPRNVIHTVVLRRQRRTVCYRRWGWIDLAILSHFLASKLGNLAHLLLYLPRCRVCRRQFHKTYTDVLNISSIQVTRSRGFLRSPNCVQRRLNAIL